MLLACSLVVPLVTDLFLACSACYWLVPLVPCFSNVELLPHISLVISRLFEKLVTNQVYKHMEDNDLFSSGQSAYLRLHSTITHSLRNWYKGLDLGRLVGLVFFDLKKAFDTVDHEILCQKLVRHGVQQRELAWFRSYLCNRKQFCQVNGVSSKTEGIDVGVPQGLCLGPLLFLIYINDLPQAVQNSTISMYADDRRRGHVPPNPCPRFRFLHREKSKTRTSRPLSNSSKKVLVSMFS